MPIPPPPTSILPSAALICAWASINLYSLAFSGGGHPVRRLARLRCFGALAMGFGASSGLALIKVTGASPEIPLRLITLALAALVLLVPVGAAFSLVAQLYIIHRLRTPRRTFTYHAFRRRRGPRGPGQPRLRRLQPQYAPPPVPDLGTRVPIQHVGQRVTITATASTQRRATCAHEREPTIDRNRSTTPLSNAAASPEMRSASIPT